MKKNDFAPGEEKLQRAYELIGQLQQQWLCLSQRQGIDSMLMGVLLAEMPRSPTLRERWDQLVSEHVASQSLELFSDEFLSPVRQEMRRRIAFWTEALDGRLQRDD